MKYLWTETLLSLLFFPYGSTIDPDSQTCQDFLVSGLSILIPGIDLVTSLQQCLVDAQHDPALETCIKNCKCTQPLGSLACATSLEACGLNCALFNEPASCFNFFGIVISDVISDLSKLNDAYQYISQFLQCLFSVPQSQSTIVPPPMQTSQAPPLMNGNCPTTIAKKGPQRVVRSLGCKTWLIVNFKRMFGLPTGAIRRRFRAPPFKRIYVDKPHSLRPLTGAIIARVR